MKKDFRKINLLILPIFFFLIGLGFILLSPAMAQAKDFEVDFEYDPLFSEANFLPGDSITRYIKVTNNSAGIFKIATKADNWIDNDGLGDVLNLEIKQGGVSRYNKKLSDFFNDGIVFLPDLTNGTQTQYNYIISFNPVAGNTYQGKKLEFDILIGYQSPAPSPKTYTFVPGGYSTTTTIPTTTTTIPGEIHGEATKREFFEEVGEEGTTTTTTAPPSKIVAGISTIGPFSCPVNLTIAGIHPLLASLLCLGQGMCDSCLNPWLILLLGLAITFGSAILVKKHYE
jgi:hypothetical protein